FDASAALISRYRADRTAFTTPPLTRPDNERSPSRRLVAVNSVGPLLQRRRSAPSHLGHTGNARLNGKLERKAYSQRPTDKCQTTTLRICACLPIGTTGRHAICC